jgi:putative methylase
MQKRLVRKLDLAMLLSQLEPPPSPKASLEQYTIPAELAATILHVAAYTYGDIVDKTVLDLGCGTGRLAIGSALLNAKQVIGVDIDKTAVKVASQNCVKVGLEDRVQWIVADIEAVCGEFDTVVQNPPFGIQKRRADRKFLEKALGLSKTVYSLHKNPNRDRRLIERLKAGGPNIVPVSPSPFIESFVKNHGGKIKAVYAMLMSIPHMFDFHVKRKHEFIVDLYIINRR